MRNYCGKLLIEGCGYFKVGCFDGVVEGYWLIWSYSGTFTRQGSEEGPESGGVMFM